MRIALLVILCLGAAALVLSLVRMRGERPARLALLAFLRLAALGALAVAWAGPARETTREVSIPGVAAVVMDTSQSMALPAGPGDEARHAAAQEAARTLVGEMSVAGDPPRVEWAGAAEGLEWAPGEEALAPTGRATDLRRALLGLAVERPDTAAIISDGADTEGARAGTLAALARAHGLRLATVGVGADEPPRDIAVDFVTAPRRVRAGSSFELAATVRAPGFEGLPLRAEVLRDGTRVREASVTGTASAALLRVSLRAGAPGRYRYAVRVPPREGEASTANNMRSALVQVIPDKPRVLVIAGAPSMEYAHLKRTLAADDTLDVRLLVRKAPPDVFWRDEGAPTQARLDAAAELSRADAVLLQNLPLAGVGDFPARLARFVREGGGLAVLGGPALAEGGYGAPPLADILPARVGGAEYVDEVFRPRRGEGDDPLSRALREAELPFEALHALRGRNVIAGAKTGAATPLQAADGAPLLASWQVERGRALFLATDGVHRWVFNPSGDERGARATAEFWGVLLDWLTEVRDRRPAVAEFDREVYEAGAPARLIVQVTDASFQPVTGATVVAEVLTPAGAGRVTCAPVEGHAGRYEAAIATEREGPLRVRVTAREGGRELGRDDAEAAVTPVLRELAAGRPDLRLLRALGEAGGGGHASAERAAELAAAVRPAPRTVERVAHDIPARGPGMLALLIMIWALDWGLRRRWRQR